MVIVRQWCANLSMPKPNTFAVLETANLQGQVANFLKWDVAGFRPFKTKKPLFNFKV